VPASEGPPVNTSYEDLLAHVLVHGTDKTDRTGTGTGTRSIFGHQLRFDLAEGFPLITTKAVRLSSVVVELLWFLRGGTNVAWLNERGVHIWDAWADERGDLGPVYGAQWRSWPTPDGEHIDQMSRVLDTLASNPDSRRMVVSAWNVADIEAAALPRATCCSSSTSPRTGCRARCISAAPTCSWVSRSTSPATPCSPTWSPSRWVWGWVISSGRAGTVTSTTTTSRRSSSS